MSVKAKAVGWIVFLLLLLGAVAGGYLFYQYKTKQLIVDLIEQFSPVAEISFSEIKIDHKGKVELIGVQVAPIGYQDVVLIDKIDMVTEDAFSLLSADTWFKGTLPKNLHLQLSSIIFSIDSDFVRSKTYLRNKNKIQTSKKTIWGLACADEVDFISLAQHLGLSRLQVDAQIKLSSDASGRVLKAAVGLSAPGLARGLFEIELASNVALNFYERNVLSQTKISNALFNITDVGFNIKRLKHCAKNEQVPESNYPDFFKATVQLKMLAGEETDLEELDESVMSFFKPRTNVVMRLSPKEALFLPAMFDPHFDFFKAKGLYLSVSTRRVSTRYLPLLKGNNVAAVKSEEEIEDVILAGIKEKAINSLKNDQIPRYRKVAINDLDAFEGREVRLKTMVGKELDGVLLKVEHNKIIMRRRVEQGLVTYPVMKASIASIKVFR